MHITAIVVHFIGLLNQLTWPFFNVVLAKQSWSVGASASHKHVGICTMVVGLCSGTGEFSFFTFLFSGLGNVLGEGTCLPSTARLYDCIVSVLSLKYLFCVLASLCLQAVETRCWIPLSASEMAVVTANYL